MRSTSLLTALALAASGLVLSAGAASAETTPNPDLKAFPTGPACADRTVTGTVRTAVVVKELPRLARPTVTVQLRWNTSGTAYADTSVVSSRTYYLAAGTGDVAWSLDASAVPSTARNLLVTAVAHPNAGSPASDTLQSKVLPASTCAAAPSNTTISRISLDCSGDVLDGEVTLADPPSSGTLPATVAVQGRAAGTTTWQPLGSKPASVTPTTTALPYQFSIAGKHLAEYRTRATVNNGAAIFSPVVSDARCAPAEVVPEAPSALLIPLTLAVTAGAVGAVRRRRAASPVPASV